MIEPPPDDRTPSDWRLLLIGWTVLALAVTLGTFPFLRVREERIFVAVFAVALCFASVPMSVACRVLWRRRQSWPRVVATMLAAAYVLGFLCSAAATAAGDRFGAAVPHAFSWQSAFGGAVTGCFALAAWSASYFGVQHSRASDTARRRVLAAEAMAREAELRALRYQINPHFLFNTLNTVSSLVIEGQSTTATHVLARLGDLFRSTLVGNGSAQVMLADEIALTEEYLDIEKIRLGDRLLVDLDVATAALPAHVPHLLLQPLVENAIRHGIAPLATGGRLTIRAVRTGDHVVITMRNDCVNAQPHKRGIGLENTAARLRQLYGSDHAFELRSRTSGEYEVSLRFPFQ